MHTHTSKLLSSGLLLLLVVVVVVVVLLLLLLLLTAIEFSLGGNSPYSSTDKTNKNKYT